MMKLRRFKRYLLIAYQSLRYALIHHHPFKKPLVKTLSKHPSHLRHAFSGQSNCLLDHYTIQFNEAACSVATAATLINCARQMVHGPSQKPVTQEDILNRVRVVGWKDRIIFSAKTATRGLPLKELGIALKTALSTYGIPVDTWAVSPVTNESHRSQAQKERLRACLTALAHSDNQFLVAHFNQGVLLKGLHLPHISPIGAFHPESGEVLVLDVDRSGPGPYWVPFDLFFKALSHDFNGTLKSMGYSGGGYIWFSLKIP